jgi:hypothetical protein
MASKSKSASTTAVTFAHHVAKEHNIEHYFQVNPFLIFVTAPAHSSQLLKRIKDCKSPDELSAQEHWLMARINSLDETLFPIGASLSMNQMLSADSQAASDADKATSSALTSVQQMITSLQNLVAERFSSLERKFDAPVSDGALRLPVDYLDADFDDRDRWSVGGH